MSWLWRRPATGGSCIRRCAAGKGTWRRSGAGAGRQTWVTVRLGGLLKDACAILDDRFWSKSRNRWLPPGPLVVTPSRLWSEPHAFT